MFSGIHLCLSFLLPRGIHLFPITSSASPPASLSLSLRPHSSSLPSSPSISSLEAERPCFFCGRSGHGAKESPRQPSVWKAFLPCQQGQTLPLFYLTDPQSWHRRSPFFFFLMLPSRLRCRHRPPVTGCASLRARGAGRVYARACWSGRSRQQPRFPRRNNWFNKLPAMFHSKEVAGAKRGRRSQEIN